MLQNSSKTNNIAMYWSLGTAVGLIGIS